MRVLLSVRNIFNHCYKSSVTNIFISTTIPKRYNTITMDTTGSCPVKYTQDGEFLRDLSKFRTGNKIMLDSTVNLVYHGIQKNTLFMCIGGRGNDAFAKNLTLVEERVNSVIQSWIFF